MSKSVHYLDLRPAKASVEGELSCKLVELFLDSGKKKAWPL